MPADKDGTKMPMQAAYDQWEPHAIALLIDTAKTYNDFVTYKQLSEFVQRQSGVTHNGLITNWIGELLGRVIKHCVSNQLPQLSALCVTSDGTVGEGYRFAMAASTGSDAEVANGTLEDLDDHAARVRLECYRFFGAEMPPGGGEPTLTPKAMAKQEWKKAQAKADEPLRLCPVHFTQLPMSGVCYDCN